MCVAHVFTVWRGKPFTSCADSSCFGMPVAAPKWRSRPSDQDCWHTVWLLGLLLLLLLLLRLREVVPVKGMLRVEACGDAASISRPPLGCDVGAAGSGRPRVGERRVAVILALVRSRPAVKPTRAVVVALC